MLKLGLEIKKLFLTYLDDSLKVNYPTKRAFKENHQEALLQETESKGPSNTTKIMDKSFES